MPKNVAQIFSSIRLLQLITRVHKMHYLAKKRNLEKNIFLISHKKEPPPPKHVPIKKLSPQNLLEASEVAFWHRISLSRQTQGDLNHFPTPWPLSQGGGLELQGFGSEAPSGWGRVAGFRARSARKRRRRPRFKNF